jgi:hypothetical protein
MTVASQFIPQLRDSDMQFKSEEELPCNMEHRTETNATKKGMKALSSRKSIMIPKLHLSGEVNTNLNIALTMFPQKKTPMK